MASPTIQFKRGLFVNLPALRLAEPGITTDKNDLYVGTGGGTAASNKFYGSSRYWTKENGSNALALNLVDKDGSNAVSLRAPATVSTPVTYTLPDGGGTQGYFLKLGAAGVLEWASVSANATFTNATLSGVTTIANVNVQSGNIDNTTIGLTTAAAGSFTALSGQNSTLGVATVTDLYVDSTRVLYDDGSGITLAGIATIDATTKSTLETILSLDPNDFTSLNVTGIGTIGGDFYANGNVSLGNSSTDTVTVYGTATFNELISGSINGNAATATALQTGRNIAVSGVVTGTTYFDGTSDVTIATTIQNDVVGLGTHTYGEYVKNLTAGAGLTGNGTGEGSTPTLAVGAGVGIEVNADDVALANHANLTDARVLKWDGEGGQVTNSIISDNGSTVTVAGNATVTGNLTVNGTTTQVNTTELAVYDRTITLGIQTGATPADTSWDLGILMNYGDAGVAKTAGVVWDYATKRLQFASNANNPGVGINTTTPDITVSSFAPIEVGELWVNNSCTGGATQVIACEAGELHLNNIVIDGGSFV